MALSDLDQATRKAPRDLSILRDLTRLCEKIGALDRARHGLARMSALAPEDGPVQLELGLAWKRNWLSSLDGASYASSVQCLVRAALLLPADPEPRFELAIVALAKGNLDLARRAALSALGCGADRFETRLILGSVCYRGGEMSRADSLFAATIPTLAPAWRAHFEDLSLLDGDRARMGAAPVASRPTDGVSPPDAPEFWRARDPDLTTPENEVEIGFRARVAHALLLFGDARNLRWDERCELFVRYGLPSAVTMNPPEARLEYQYTRYVPNAYAPDPLEYPFNVQVWSYPELGMQAELWDVSLTQSYQLPIAADWDPDPKPDPGVLASRPDLVMLGRGVYRVLPPGTSPMKVRARVSRFSAASGTRLLIQLEAAGGPSDSLWAAWVVVDPNRREVARGAGTLVVSACDPGQAQVGQFDAEVPPGDYRLDVSVDDHRTRRGVVHLESLVAPASANLEVSDLILMCGSGASSADGNVVWVEPNWDARVEGNRPASFYFEIDHLMLGPDGSSRFRYTYRVVPARPDAAHAKPAEALINVSHDEEHMGSHRRQFVTVPLRSLHRGAYDFEIQVQDLVSGKSQSRSVRFDKD